MLGLIGRTLKKRELNPNSAAGQKLEGVFAPDFQNIAGWRAMLDNIPTWDVEKLLNRSGGHWEIASFHALYVACWIYHPVEKGTFMIPLNTVQRANVAKAYDDLLDTRQSSHLAGTGTSVTAASAHQGWNFLQGYKELLVQIDDPGAGPAYLFLKCEGHPIKKGDIFGTILHTKAYLAKTFTGEGELASPALHNLANISNKVEQRAAENYSTAYEKLLNKLGLRGTTITVHEMLTELFRQSLSHGQTVPNLPANTHDLGNAMLGPAGHIATLEGRHLALKHSGVKFTPELKAELTNLAERMRATSAVHPHQYYNEIRVTPAELTHALTVFKNEVA